MNDKDEWGNTSLPGLDDEKLFNTNWNRVAAGLENKNNIKLQTLAESKRGNKEFSKTMTEAAIARNQNPQYQQNHRIGVTVNRDNTYQAECNSRPEVKAKISKALTGKEKTPEHIAKVAKKSKERGIPCVTPFGVFRTGADAGRMFDELKLGLNGKKTVNKYIKQKREGYYQISIEEYIMLTGKDL